MTAIIVSGGTFSPAEQLPEDAFVIACDRGLTYCDRLGLNPDLLISDFDSYSGPVPDGIAIEEHIPEKDDTDTMLAVKYALTHGYRKLILCCALGGRLDHLLANLQSLIFAAAHGAQACILSEDTIVYTLHNGRMTLPRREGWSLSLFAMDRPCQGVSIRGAKYPLENAEILPSFPLGVSNEWIDESAELSVEDGTLLVMMCRNTPG